MDCPLLLPSVQNKPTLDTTNGIVRMVREEPPTHCIFEVESFSKLNIDHLDSSEFKAGGYTWVLSVYPNGHKQKGGQDHLSLFVSMVDKLEGGSFVYVMLRFFIYDQLRENFLTVLDVRDKLIHGDIKSTPGIPKFLPLQTLMDASNGFLVNDCCVFGVEVYIKDAPKFRPELSVKDGFNKEICATPLSYTWKIEYFSQLQNSYSSPVFRIDEWYWTLWIHPNGTKATKGKYMSVFLKLENPTKIPEVGTLHTEFQICLKNQGGQEDHKKTTSRNFPRVNSEDWGFTSFIEISDLYSKGFLLNDALILEVVIEELLIERLVVTRWEKIV